MAAQSPRPRLRGGCSKLKLLMTTVMMLAILSLLKKQDSFTQNNSSSIRSWHPNATTTEDNKDTASMVSTAAISHGLLQTATGDTATRTTDEDSKQRPVLALHIGPEKVGTTFLQSSLGRSTTKNILLKDNLIYVGSAVQKKSSATLVLHEPDNIFDRRILDVPYLIQKQIQHNGDGVNDRNFTLQPGFVNGINRLRNSGRNGLFVEEYLSHLTELQIQALAETLSSDFSVRIMIAYRPWYQWLLSFHMQRHRVRYPSWPTDEATNGSIPFSLVEGDPGMAPFIFQVVRSNPKHWTHILQDSYSKFFSDIQILPLHRMQSTASNDAQLEYIFCVTTLSSFTKNACKAAKDGRIGFGVSNEQRSINYDLIAVQAYRDGLLPPRLSRTSAKDKVEKYQASKNLSDMQFPLVCPSNASLKELEEMSLNMERRLFSDDTKFPQDDELHRRGFQSYISKNKFCHVDAKKVLMEQDWKDFFASMWPKGSNRKG